jgi:Polyketide cyclase / dehydrase and lipid transport
VPKSYASTVINTSPDDVWARIRHFNALPEWTDGAIEKSELEGGLEADQVGVVRHLVLGNGEVHIRERLLTLSDEERSYTYNFESSPFEVDNYLCTIRVTPVTDGGGSFVEWWTTFDCNRDEQAHWTGFFANEVFQGGFNALKAHFGDA